MVSHFEQMNFQVQEIRGVHETILGLIGDTSRLDTDDIKSMDTVAEVKRIQEPYKNANRKFHPDDTVIDVCGRKIGGGIRSRLPAQDCCVAAHSSLAPPHTPSRDCARKGWITCWKPKKHPVCPLSPKS